MAPRMIFINLPVIDVPKATKFYESIGGSINPNFTTPECTCMVFSESIYVMIMTVEMFKGEFRYLNPSHVLRQVMSLSEDTAVKPHFFE